MTSAAFTPATDVVASGLALLTSQWAEDPYVTGVLESVLARVQELEDAAAVQALAMDIANAPHDYQLDRIGRILVLEREGRSNTVYRLWLSARVLAIKSRGKNKELVELAQLLAPVGASVVRTRYGHAAFEIIYDGAPLTTEEGSAVAQILRSARRAGVYFRFAWQSMPDAETLRLADDDTLDATASHGLGAELGGDSLGLKTYWDAGLLGALGARLTADYHADRAAFSSSPAVSGLMNAADPGVNDLAPTGEPIIASVLRGRQSMYVEDDGRLQALAGGAPLLQAGQGFAVCVLAGLASVAAERWFLQLGKSGAPLVSLYHDGTDIVASAEMLPGPATVTVTRAVSDLPAFESIVFDVGPEFARLYLGTEVVEVAAANDGLADAPDQVSLASELLAGVNDAHIARALVVQRSAGATPQDVSADDAATQTIVELMSEPYWRNTIPFVQASFVAGEIVSGQVATAADTIPPGFKRAADGSYTLVSVDASRRPDLGADGAMVFDAGNSEILQGASSLAALMQGNQHLTIITIGSWSGALTGYQSMVSVGKIDSDANFIEATHRQDSRARSVRAQASTFQVSVGSPVLDTNAHAFASKFDGTTLSAFVDGALATTPNATTKNPAALNVFALGGLARLTSVEFASCRMFETIVCLGSLSTFEIQSIGARALAEWT